MQCKCGGHTIPQEHQVKTIKKAKEWFSKTETSHLPVIIEQNICVGCGRISVWVWDNKGKRLSSR